MKDGQKKDSYEERLSRCGHQPVTKKQRKVHKVNSLERTRDEPTATFDSTLHDLNQSIQNLKRDTYSSLIDDAETNLVSTSLTTVHPLRRTDTFEPDATQLRDQKATVP